MDYKYIYNVIHQNTSTAVMDYKYLQCNTPELIGRTNYKCLKRKELKGIGTKQCNMEPKTLAIVLHRHTSTFKTGLP